MLKIFLFLLISACGSDVQPVQQQPPVVTPPGGGGGNGGGFQFSDLFNGRNGPGDQTCGKCHGGDAFLQSQQGFCSKGLPRVQNGTMPPNGKIDPNLVAAMQQICF